MKNYDVMSVDIVCAKENATIIEAATRIVLGGFNGIPIINDDGMVIGILTTLDILNAIKDSKDINSTAIGEIMTVNPIPQEPDTGVTAQRAYRGLRRQWFGEVQPGLRHALRRGSAPLCRELFNLRPAVPGSDG